MKTGQIYFLRRADGLVKIGFTSGLKRRLEHLTRAHGNLEVIRLLNGDKRREKRLHNEFGKYNQFGEWFRGTTELLHKVAALEDGELVKVSKSEAKANWLRGEARLAGEARQIVLRLVEARRQRTGCKNDAALKEIATDYGISVWMLKNIHSGRANVITAYAMRVLQEALPVELMRQRDELLADIKSVEETGALAARLETAKGQAARAGK